jgi:phosphate transport system permease protein
MTELTAAAGPEPIGTGRSAQSAADPDVPRTITAAATPGDRIFRGVLRGGGLAVFVITGLILVFLIVQSSGAFKTMGLGFFTTSTWLVAEDRFGIAAILPDGALIAAIALVVAVPVALAAALFVSEYAPAALRRPLIALIDLMAAIPSIVYALWGVYFLEPRIIGVARWLSDHTGTWFPPVKVAGGDIQALFASSPFIAGLVVSLMVVPIVTSISREVFSQAPQGEREAAYALGSSRWGMIRAVVLPYGRGGMIGAIMLGFGRAMGETIAISLIISPVFLVNWHVLETGGMSIPALIALRYTESTPEMLSALMAAGLVLFTVTLAVNALAGAIITRTRSGMQGAEG